MDNKTKITKKDKLDFIRRKLGSAVALARKSLLMIYQRGQTPPGRKAEEGVAVFTPGSFGGYREGLGTLRCSGGDCGGGSEMLVVDGNAKGLGVRRLTPTECERIHGFPAGWTGGFSNPVRYKMLGNAVCVKIAEWIARRMAATMDGHNTTRNEYEHVQDSLRKQMCERQAPTHRLRPIRRMLRNGRGLPHGRAGKGLHSHCKRPDPAFGDSPRRLLWFFQYNMDDSNGQFRRRTKGDRT